MQHATPLPFPCSLAFSPLLCTHRVSCLCMHVIRPLLTVSLSLVFFGCIKSIVNNSGYLYRPFHSRTKSASLDSHMYVSGWLLCCHGPKYLQDPLHHVLSWPDQDDILRQDLIHCSGS